MKTNSVSEANKNLYMKMKKALGGLFRLLGTLAAFFDCFLPAAPVPLRFNLNDALKKRS